MTDKAGHVQPLLNGFALVFIQRGYENLAEERQAMPETIYHYTSWVTFEKILCNKSLRLGDLQSMNDYKESIHFLEIFERKICSMLSTANFEDKIPEAKEIIGQLRDNIYTERAYALCFSKLKDDAAQWERYGQMGQGVCLGFNANKLSRQVEDSRLGLCRIQQVYYLESLDGHEHLDIFFQYLTTSNLKGFKSIDNWKSNFHATASAFKHESFESEKEIRLVSLPLANTFKSWLDNDTAKMIYEAKADRIRSYIEISLPCIEQCISEITIGPRSSQDIYELHEILNRWNCNSLVERDCFYLSQCPLR